MNVRVQGRAAVEKFIAGLLKTVPDFRFKDTQIFSDVTTTPARLASGWLAGLYREGVEPS
jgi:hypothetical protein